MELEMLNAEKKLVLKPVLLPAISDLISEMSVSTDSVVATITIKLKSGTKQLRVDWGDNKSTLIRLDRIANLPNSGLFTILGDGWFEIRHVYEPPADGSSFITTLLVKASSNSDVDFKVSQLNIIPRYQVHFADVYFRLIDSGDFGEPHSEWSISMNVIKYNAATYTSEPLGPTASWRFDAIPESVLPSDWYRLQNSGRSTEMVKGDYLYAYFNFTETDFIWDDVFRAGITLDILQPTDGIERNNSTNTFTLRYYQQIKLIKNVPNNIPPVLHL